MNRTRGTFLALVAVFLSPMAVNADVITTSAGDYEVTILTGTFADLSAQLMDQIWWEDVDLAAEFASLSQDLLGFSALNSGPFGGIDIGALFAVCDDACLFASPLGQDIHSVAWINVTGYTGLAAASTFPDTRLDWAIATKVAEPGTLALLGAGLIIMGSARRRKTT